MDFRPLIDIGIVLGAVVVFAGFFYSFYKFPSFRQQVKNFLPFLPAFFSFFAARTTDTGGKFDPHDVWALMDRIAEWMQEVISDPENTQFEDVQVELMSFVAKELEIYRAAGVENVPDATDETIEVYVKVAFEAIRRAMCEDSSRDHL